MSGAAVSFQRKVPVRHEVDVFVAGGGPAGAAAAVAARRGGASVFLAEAHSCLGGMGTAGLVPAFMRFGDGENFLAAGVGRQILNRLHAAGGTGPGRHDPGNPAIGSIAIDAEILKRVYDDLLTEAQVAFTFHTQLVAVQTAGEAPS